MLDGKVKDLINTTGAQGPVGAQGPQGPVGAQGPPGYNGTNGVCACDNGGATGPGKLGDEYVFFIIGLFLLNLFTLAYVCVSKRKERAKFSIVPGNNAREDGKTTPTTKKQIQVLQGR